MLYNRTMLRLTDAQRITLADKLFDAANIAAGAMIFGQFLGDQPFSVSLAFFGSVTWLGLVAVGLLLSGGARS